VEIGGTKVTVEVSQTDAAREKGLMFRESLPENAGMLFIFDKPDFYAFWMKDTLIPLDIIWIDGNKIVDIKTDLPPGQGEFPPAYVTSAPADMVLEVNAGFAKKNNVQVNDTVKIVVPQ
jgi:uncharacterized membrane protein (UPF0127 family)